ncbi:MAG: response regulator [Endomicrobia bacterium]|nr:response regulator [Endomicrobiia bacterium]
MLTTKRILIVDDEPDILKVTVFRIKKAGYEVITATDGKQGLEMVKTEKPDMIFLDLGLPTMNGAEVCKALKSDEELKKIPIVIFSASSDKAAAIATEAEADDLLIKPFEPEELLAKIQKFIR